MSLEWQQKISRVLAYTWSSLQVGTLALLYYAGYLPEWLAISIGFVLLVVEFCWAFHIDDKLFQMEHEARMKEEELHPFIWNGNGGERRIRRRNGQNGHRNGKTVPVDQQIHETLE